MRWLLLIPLLLFGSCGTNSSQKEYTIAIDPSWYPLNLMGREKQLHGFTIDLLQEIAAYKKITIFKVRENWDNLIPHLQQEKYDAILSSLQPYLFYEKQYDFSSPFLLIGPVLVVPENSSLTSLDKCAGKEIAILDGSKDALILEKYPQIIIRNYYTLAEIFRDILSGALDGALVDTLVAQAYCQDLYRGQLKIATAPLTNAGLRLITLHKMNSPLPALFDEGLQELQKSGKYEELLKKWSL